MSDPKSHTQEALRRLIWPLRLTRAGMVAERATRAFWPLWSLLFIALAAVAFGAAPALGQPGIWIAGAVALGLIVWALIRGIRAFQMPSHEEALDRLDRTMPGRPITALLDTVAVGHADPATQSVWDVHVARMAGRASAARAPEPDLRLSSRDPYALRYVAATAMAMALLFGTLGRVSDVGDVVTIGPGAASASGPSWEGWVEPPIYTGLPSLYLNDIVAEAFETPRGSRISLRFYGNPEDITVTSDLGPPQPGDAGGATQTLIVERSGSLTVFAPSGTQSWDISVRADAAPSVALDGELEGEPPGQMQLSFTASDDFGVAAGTATFRLDPDATDRRFGLAVEPEPREALTLDLPMPFRGSRTDFTEVMVEDLAAHPFANLPVTLTLTVTDDAGQIGTVSYDIPRLPGRRFFDPLANAVVELRRDILWSRENANRSADLLRALTARPENGLDEAVYLQLRTAIRRLESGIDSISEETRDQVAEILWNAALVLEEGDLDNALERLRQAQERLSEAMRQGASDEEIAELMQELREAMNDYMRELAQNAEPGDSTDQPDQGERTEMSMADLEEMLRRIEELMAEGRMAEAQEMLNALQQMLENMEITQAKAAMARRRPVRRPWKVFRTHSAISRISATTPSATCRNSSAASQAPHSRASPVVIRARTANSHKAAPKARARAKGNSPVPPEPNRVRDGAAKTAPCHWPIGRRRCAGNSKIRPGACPEPEPRKAIRPCASSTKPGAPWMRRRMRLKTVTSPGRSTCSPTPWKRCVRG
jgi:uncharacterized protein (TIGR02302 family)